MVCAVYYTLCVAVASEHGTVEMKKTSGPSCTVTKSSSEWGGKNGPTPTLPVVTFLPLVAKKKQEDRRRACALRHLVVMESSCTQPAALPSHHHRRQQRQSDHHSKETGRVSTNGFLIAAPFITPEPPLYVHIETTYTDQCGVVARILV